MIPLDPGVLVVLEKLHSAVGFLGAFLLLGVAIILQMRLISYNKARLKLFIQNPQRAKPPDTGLGTRLLVFAIAILALLSIFFGVLFWAVILTIVFFLINLLFLWHLYDMFKEKYVKPLKN